MKTSELDYELPEALIAQAPSPERGASRLLVVDRATGELCTDVYANVGRYLKAGDCLVLNDTRVIRARLHGQKITGGKVEIFLLHEDGPGVWTALVRPSAKVKPGSLVRLAGGIEVRVAEVLPEGRRRVVFDRPDVLELLESIGEIPLPPYIHRDGADPSDLRRYQTVYAAQPGAVAAPTAGLHLTEALLQALTEQGVQQARLTLHVGYGTFKPISVETLEAHQVDGEDFELSEAAAERLDATRAAGGRVIAVGTTSTRVLESQYRDGRYRAGKGATHAYIYPPYTFQAVDVLQTNFHLPRSSLLALVCAFAGHELVMKAYRHAVQERFRFYSYGDAMLIL
ncbi:MAG: tRNA preQ1(34) S-adenosylmethionine ribosyltransferase-isomerase QueA [Candidatus Hydrogenedentes bacterium]|nr:tRNA preQ1(34) S-adenosylmethionine ribosyltransferase-isomerase QueA [Candidatus Hydrogenedentota bacterium]